PMPQEAGTASMVSRRGAGILLKRSNDIVPVIQNLLADQNRYASMKDAASLIAIPDSTQNIIREITALLPTNYKAASTNGGARS
ncbi:MAG: hypothetical protein KDB79_06775, partial [Acidobacteria bacterium]|nr:hypothetical protein [Acidobacteriota bacterium]